MTSSSTRLTRSGSKFILTPSSARLLLDRYLASKSTSSVESAHARLIKAGVDTRTSLANRLIHLYARFGLLASGLRIFTDLSAKNTFTWNITMAALCHAGQVDCAYNLFEEMPDRDVVSWNTMVSGYIWSGSVSDAFRVLHEMRYHGVSASAFTLSIAMSGVSYPQHVKEIHGSAVRSGLESASLVLGNSLIDSYGKFDHIEYTVRVFHRMEKRDIISWNSVISGCGRCGSHTLALHYFGLMRAAASITPDPFTLSTVVSICADFGILDKGEQAFSLSFKMGYISNSIILSAVIDMYSQCGRLDDSVKLFEETRPNWDSAILDSMVSALAVNDLTAECQNVFLAAMKVGINPTEFTFSKILKSGAGSAVIGHVEQFHSMIFKLGLAGEMVVASSLIDIYSKQGSLGSAMKIFTEASFRDLPCWNSIIIGLAEHGRGVEALNLFKELQENCLKPDWITLMGVLSACSLHGLVDEGTHIFQKMEEKYGVERGIEHYNCILDMMIREGMLEEAMQIIKSIPWKFSASVYDRLLDVCTAYGNIKLAELTANETVGLNTNSAFPYVVLARIYESRGQWEKAAWVKRAMEENSAWKPRDDSWIGLKNHIFTFESSGLQHWGGDTTYSVLRLLERHVQEFEATQSDNFVGTDKSNTLKEGDGGTSIDLFLDIHN